ncbi:MAG: hypothetical protein CMJ65_01935 [Planctomycetaceae bacterium]|nr:hypothetical protein [Planctomycetaceae bacterium]
MRISRDSAVAPAAADGSQLGAFAPVDKPAVPVLETINVRDFGARGDGRHDDSPAIQAAVGLAQRRGGGRVLVPPSSRVYLLGSTIRIRNRHVTLTGPGATLKLKSGAGRIHLIHIGGDGPTRSIAEHIEVSGLTLDGNYRQQPQQRAGGLPRCVWVENACHVTLRQLRIRDAWCGVSFATHTRRDWPRMSVSPTGTTMPSARRAGESTGAAPTSVFWIVAQPTRPVVSRRGKSRREPSGFCWRTALSRISVEPEPATTCGTMPIVGRYWLTV